jgi:hypothetical protein
MMVPGLGPTTSNVIVAAIGTATCSPRAAPSPPGLDYNSAPAISTGGCAILGKISKRGNPYLRVLFVQAAWLVLIQPRSWERRGLKPGSKPPRSDCIIAFWRSRSLTSSPLSPGRFSTRGVTSNVSRRTRWRPDLPERGILLAALTPWWPGSVGS